MDKQRQWLYYQILAGRMMKYIGYYGDGAVRLSSPAADKKMDYIASVLSKFDRVEIVSASGVFGKRTDRAKKVQLADGITLRLFHSIGRKNKWIGKLSSGWTRVQLLIYLLLKTRRNEKLIAYHSLGYQRIIALVKRLKGFFLILEVEEIYSDVTGDEKTRNKELRFFQQADAYMFPTKLLDDAINTEHKPSVIVHGTYKVEPDRHCKFDERMLQVDGKPVIHCVYAGTLDPRKGGAIAAAAAAAFLPSNYHIHILGFGSGSDVQAMKDHVVAVAKRSKARVTYDGVLTGEEYVRFIQSCDIGLSTQDPDAAFNATSFPSKILSYLANGLRVVSIRIPAVEQSDVGDMLTYYDIQTPEKIAKAILTANINTLYNSRERLESLDERFFEDLRIIYCELAS